MQTLWLLAGRILYYCCYPALAWYLSRSDRTRAIIFYGDQVLLVRPWLGNGDWDLPGGGVHSNETPITAVAREIREELSIDDSLAALQFIETATFSKGLIRYQAHYFGLQLLQKPTLRLQVSELVAAQWVVIDQLDRYPLPDAYRTRIQKQAQAMQ